MPTTEGWTTLSVCIREEEGDKIREFCADHNMSVSAFGLVVLRDAMRLAEHDIEEFLILYPGFEVTTTRRIAAKSKTAPPKEGETALQGATA